MKIKQKINFVTGNFDTDCDELICVGISKYHEVLLCFKGIGSNIPFA